MQASLACQKSIVKRKFTYACATARLTLRIRLLTYTSVYLTDHTKRPPTFPNKKCPPVTKSMIQQEHISLR